MVLHSRQYPCYLLEYSKVVMVVRGVVVVSNPEYFHDLLK